MDIQTIREKALRGLVALIGLFLVVNLLILSVFGFGNSNLSRPHPKAKVLLSMAEGVNVIYVLPMTKRFVDSLGLLFVQPFRGVRDAFYRAGIQTIPADDAEREIWWAKLYYPEIKLLYNESFSRFIYSRGYEGAGRHWRWLDEVYGHLIHLSQLNHMADRTITFPRLSYYSGAGLLYLRNQADLYSRIFTRYFSTPPTLGFMRPYLEDPAEVSKVADLLDGYLTLKKRVHQEERQTFTPDGQESAFEFLASGTLLGAKIIQKDRDLCQNPYIPLFTDNILKLQNYQSLRKMELSELVAFNLQKQCGLLEQYEITPAEVPSPKEYSIGSIERIFTREKIPLSEHIKALIEADKLKQQELKNGRSD